MNTNQTIANKKSQIMIIFLTVFIYLLGFGIIIPIIPILSRDFGANAFQSGLLMSSYSLMQFIFSPFWGRLSDRYGRRPILLFCLILEAVSYIIFATARSLEMLFIARLLAGFFGASISTASAYISDITPPNERSKGMALIGAAFGLGFVFGPAIGGGLTLWAQSISPERFFDTSFSAYFVAILCILNFSFGLKFLKESLSEKNVNPIKKSRIESMMRYFKMHTVGWLLFVFLISSIAMSGMEATFILFMGDKFGWKIKEVSFGFAYLGIVMVFTQGFLVRKVIPLFGERKVLRIGLASFAIGLFGIAASPSVPLMAIAVTFLALGTGLINPSTLGSISLLTPSNEQGASLGVTQSMASLGRILGPALGGGVYAVISIHAPFVVSGFMALLALAIVAMIYNHIPEAGKLNEK